MFLCWVVIPVLLIACHPGQESVPSGVQVKGAMKNVMWKGELEGIVQIDTLQKDTLLYGLGPDEFLRGELMTLAGISYRSRIVADTGVVVEVYPAAKPPFYVYQYVEQWQSHILPDTVVDLVSLQQYLEQMEYAGTPFSFQLEGQVSSAAIHIQNLTLGSVVRSPKEAHAGQVNRIVKNIPVTLLGFFSDRHQGIFTHHDTYLHIHLMTKDTTLMGHVDDCAWESGALLLKVPVP